MGILQCSQGKQKKLQRASYNVLRANREHFHGCPKGKQKHRQRVSYIVLRENRKHLQRASCNVLRANRKHLQMASSNVLRANKKRLPRVCCDLVGAGNRLRPFKGTSHFLKNMHCPSGRKIQLKTLNQRFCFKVPWWFYTELCNADKYLQSA